MIGVARMTNFDCFPDYVTKKCNEAARTKSQTASAVVADATGAATTKPNVSKLMKLFDRRYQWN